MWGAVTVLWEIPLGTSVSNRNTILWCGVEYPVAYKTSRISALPIEMFSPILNAPSLCVAHGTPYDEIAWVIPVVDIRLHDVSVSHLLRVPTYSTHSLGIVLCVFQPPCLSFTVSLCCLPGTGSRVLRYDCFVTLCIKPLGRSLVGSHSLYHLVLRFSCWL